MKFILLVNLLVASIMKHRKIPYVSPELIDILRIIYGDYMSGGWLIFGEQIILIILKLNTHIIGTRDLY